MRCRQNEDKFSGSLAHDFRSLSANALLLVKNDDRDSTQGMSDKAPLLVGDSSTRCAASYAGKLGMRVICLIGSLTTGSSHTT